MKKFFSFFIASILILSIAPCSLGDSTDVEYPYSAIPSSFPNIIIYAKTEKDLSKAISTIESTNKNSEDKIFTDGNLAYIKTDNGNYYLGFTKATILPATNNRGEVYQITWEYENESFKTPSGNCLMIGPVDFTVYDSNGYVVEPMSSGWEGDMINTYVEIIPGKKCVSSSTFVINDPSCNYLEIYFNSRDVLYKVNIEQKQSKETIASESNIREEKSTKKPVTSGQMNALKSADNYLKYAAFSYASLIEQLEYEGYSHDEATYAAENIGADWNEQAVKSAEAYLAFSAFSYASLIEQLEYEGFTHNQAAYGVETLNIDWNQQAAKSAKSYLEYSSFSRNGLIEQLEYEGFTYEQAVYGVGANGY